MSRFIGLRCPLCKRTGCCDTIIYYTSRFCYDCRDNSNGECGVVAPENEFNGFVKPEVCLECMARIRKAKEENRL